MPLGTNSMSGDTCIWSQKFWIFVNEVDKAASPLYSANTLQYPNVFVKCGKYVIYLLIPACGSVFPCLFFSFSSFFSFFASSFSFFVCNCHPRVCCYVRSSTPSPLSPRSSCNWGHSYTLVCFLLNFKGKKCILTSSILTVPAYMQTPQWRKGFVSMWYFIWIKKLTHFANYSSIVSAWSSHIHVSTWDYHPF